MSSVKVPNSATPQGGDADFSTAKAVASSRLSTGTFDLDPVFGFTILRKTETDDSISAFSQNPLTLRFKDREIEDLFAEQYYGPTLGYFRMITVLVVLFYLVFLILALSVDSDDSLIIRVVQFSASTIVAVLFNAIGFILQIWRRRKMKEDIAIASNAIRNQKLPSSSTRSLESPRFTKIPISSNMPMPHEKVGPKPLRFGCVSLYDLLDYFLITPYTGLTLSLQAIISGYNMVGISTATIAFMLGLVLLLRARVFPAVMIASVLGPTIHVVSHLVAMAVGRTSRNINSKIVIETVLEAVFSNIEVFLVGCLIIVSVGMQYENNVRRLFVVSERSRRLCEAVAIENGRERALLKNVFPEKLLPMFLSQEEKRVQDGIRYASSGKAMIGMVINDIAGFTAFCSKTETQVVFRFLNQVYHRFDIRAQANGLSKVKTIGDSWEGCIFHVEGEDEEGCDPSQDAAICVLTALGMVRDFDKVLTTFAFSSSSSSTLALRSGVSISADSWVYLIGSTKPGAMLSFDVIGEAVKRASLLETGSEEGEVFACETVREVLMDDERFDFEDFNREF